MTADRAAWLEERRSGIGASEVAGVLGLSPWSSPWSIWAAKCIDGAAQAQDRNPSPEMDLGRRLEPITAELFTESTGLHLAGEQMLCRHPKMPWAIATVDALAVEGAEPLSIADTLGPVELKYSAEAPWADGPPEHYWLQVQWQMFVTGTERGWLAVLHLPFGRPRFKVYEVDYAPQRMAEVVTAVERFWCDHVETGTPPPTDAHPATTEALATTWPHPEGDAVDLDAYAATLAELADYKAERKRLDGFITMAENELKAALGDHADGRIGGFLAVSWREQSRRDIDRDAVRREFGDRFDTTSIHRVLRLHAR